MDIHGSSGKIALRGRNFLQFEVEVSSNTVAAYREPTYIRPAVRRDNITMMLVPELEEFARAIHEERSPAITIGDGRHVLKVLDAVIQSHRASGRETVYEKLLVAKQSILAAIHIRFRVILGGNSERDLVLTARYLAGETLSALAHEFGLTPQRVFQIVNLSN